MERDKKKGFSQFHRGNIILLKKEDKWWPVRVIGRREVLLVKYLHAENATEEVRNPKKLRPYEQLEEPVEMQLRKNQPDPTYRKGWTLAFYHMKEQEGERENICDSECEMSSIENMKARTQPPENREPLTAKTNGH